LISRRQVCPQPIRQQSKLPTNRRKASWLSPNIQFEQLQQPLLETCWAVMANSMPKE
jgi:hypothetical protein